METQGTAPLEPERNGKHVELRVAEALQDDVDKGIVRIDVSFLKELGINIGSIVEIEGRRRTIAIVDRAYPADLGLHLIRMDGSTRKNSEAGIGEIVKIRPINVREAAKVVIAPYQQNITITGAPQDLFQRSLLGRAVVNGDVVPLGGAPRRTRVFSQSPFEDLFSMISKEVFSTFVPGIKVVVLETEPGGPVIITENTRVEYRPKAKAAAGKEEKLLDVTYEDIGGLSEEIKKVREMIEIPLKYPELFQHLGIEPPKGILLYGPPGTGKTLLAKAVANETSAFFLSLAGPEIMHKFVGEAEKKLRDIFAEAEKNAPGIIFIDELDSIASKREEVLGEVERRVVAQLLTLMDGLRSRGNVIVIGATNRPDALDEALRRPGRFDREIEISVPNKGARLEILKIHTRNMPLEKDVELEEVAAITHGFVGADLASLAKEAAMNVLRRVLSKVDLNKDEKLPEHIYKKLIITKKDLKEALKVVKPSGMREIFVETPEVHWEQIGGLEEIKRKLMEAIEWPIKYPERFSNMGVKAPKGILLYGPPGTGKTLLAKAVATETESNFISIKGPELISKWVGESEKAVRDIFKKARQVAPAIIFFDEFDSLVPIRGLDDSRVSERVVNQFLTEMDGLDSMKDVIVIAATNRPELIDPAVIRPGRLDVHILIPPPDEKTRLAIFSVHTKKMPLLEDVDLEELAAITEGYSGADIESLCREAAMVALRKDINSQKISREDFERARESIVPTLSKIEIEEYKNSLEKAKLAKLEQPNYFG